MPATPSSPIPAALTQLTHTAPRQLHHAEARTCWPIWPASPTPETPVAAATGWSPSWLWPLPQCWQGRGRSPRSPNGPLIPQQVRVVLGARQQAPGGCFAVPAEATIRRTLARLDADTLASVIGAWFADRDRHREHDRPGPATHRRRAVAVDGKTLRRPHP